MKFFWSYVALIVFSLLVVLQGLSEYVGFKKNHAVYAQEHVETHAKDLTRFFSRAVKVSLVMSVLPSVHALLRNNQVQTIDQDPVIRTVFDNNLDFAELSLIDLEGREQFKLNHYGDSQGVLTELNNLKYTHVYKYISEKPVDPVWIGFFKDDSLAIKGSKESPYVAQYLKPVIVDNVLVGYVSIKIFAEPLLDQMKGLPQFRKVYLIDQMQRFIWATKDTGIEWIVNDSDLSLELSKESLFVQPVISSDEVSYRLVFDDEALFESERYAYFFVYASIVLVAALFVLFVQLLINRMMAQKLESEVEKVREDLLSQSKYAVMGEMLGMISHQWKQPLTVVMGNVSVVEMLLDDVDLTPDKRQQFVALFEQTNQMLDEQTNTLNDFLNYLKPQSRSSDFELKHCVEQVVELMKGSLKNNSVNLIVDVDESIIISGAERELQQVLVNLVKNALDQFEALGVDKPILSIKGFRQEGTSDVCLQVEDNGGGISQDMQSKLFEAYASSKSLNGTGLGLYIVKLMIEDHFNGSVRGFNQNDGAVFEIVFPMEK